MKTYDAQTYSEWEASFLRHVCDAAQNGDAFYVGFVFAMVGKKLKAGKPLPRVLSNYVGGVLTRLANNLGSARKALGLKLDRRLRPGKTERDLDIAYRVYAALISDPSKSVSDACEDVAEQLGCISNHNVAKVWHASRDARKPPDKLSVRSDGALWSGVDLSLEPPLIPPSRLRKSK